MKILNQAIVERERKRRGLDMEEIDEEKEKKTVAKCLSIELRIHDLLKSSYFECQNRMTRNADVSVKSNHR